MKVYLQILCSCFILVMAGCAKNTEELEDPVLAQVGESRITASQLIGFEQRLPKELKTEKSGVDGYRDYLQTLIDKEIYLQEAIKRGLDKVPQVEQKLRKETEDNVLRQFFKQEFVDKVSIEEEKLKALYETAEKVDEMKLRLIIVETEEEAKGILQSIDAGADFGELARTRSLHESTALQGGELDGYLTADRVPVYLQKYIEPLEVGQYSDPIRLPNGQFGVYQITYTRPVSFSTVRGALIAKLREQETSALVEAYMQRLRADVDLQANTETLRLLQGWVEAGRRDFSAEERGLTLYSFSGKSIEIGDFWIHAEELDMGFSGDIPESVRWFAEDVLLSRTLFLHVAHDKGIDQDPQIVQQRQRRKNALLLLELRQTAVKDRVEISSEVVRQFYTKKPELFTPPEEVSVQEIMVKTREEANTLKNRVEAGEDMGTLADEFTLRAVGKGAGGKFHIHTFEQGFYGELIDATRAAQVGQVYGPVAVTARAIQVKDPQAMHPGGDYYSVFKVLESNFGSSPEPFEKVEKRAKALLIRNEESRLASQFLSKLRQDYQGQIVIHDDQLQVLLTE
jgi:peptidyl-prolyl cis-trans isomerase C